MTPIGLLNIDKPPGISSRAAVDRVVRLVRPAKAGHAGTLDPIASGVLAVCIGRATRLIRYVQQWPKRYRATFLLGYQSVTDDIEGDVQLLESAPVPTQDAIVAATVELTGEIEQLPPAFSAVKVAGRRAYELARKGKKVELTPRNVTVYALQVLAYRYPELVLDIECSAGTYVRSLGRDLATRLGTAAVMSALCRTAIGPLRVEDACRLDDLSPATLGDRLLPPLAAVGDLPSVALDASQIEAVGRGMTVALRDESIAIGAAEVAAVDAEHQLVAILVRRGSVWGPVCNLGCNR